MDRLKTYQVKSLLILIGMFLCVGVFGKSKSNGSTTDFDYDAVGNLASATYNLTEQVYKLPNRIGNLYRSRNWRERRETKYDKGSRLIEDKEWQYGYDKEGNLIRKTSKTQKTKRFSLLADDTGYLDWTYTWNANGSLRSAYNNDGVHLSFEYDALGRRTAKINHNTKKIKRFLWDGNVPLHEWEYPLSEKPELVSDKDGVLTYKTPEPREDLTTWIFEEDSFVPIAKLQNGERFSIFTDHLGTPVMAVDGEGEKVWSRELDIYGKTRIETGKSNFVPFLYQGQYYDEETGLAYNRFRYYDSDSGTYISQDPIRLASGEDNLYAYVWDVNSWVDILGLDYFYQLIKDGKVVYNGITKNAVKDRISDHLRSPNKDFTDFRYIEVDDRIASRNLEGSALHNADGKGLQNATRKDGQYYHSYDPDNLKEGRIYYTESEIEAKMKNANTGEIKDGKVKFNSH